MAISSQNFVESSFSDVIKCLIQQIFWASTFFLFFWQHWYRDWSFISLHLPIILISHTISEASFDKLNSRVIIWYRIYRKCVICAVSVSMLSLKIIFLNFFSKIVMDAILKVRSLSLPIFSGYAFYQTASNVSRLLLYFIQTRWLWLR